MNLLKKALLILIFISTGASAQTDPISFLINYGYYLESLSTPIYYPSRAKTESQTIIHEDNAVEAAGYAEAIKRSPTSSGGSKQIERIIGTENTYKSRRSDILLEVVSYTQNIPGGGYCVWTSDGSSVPVTTYDGDRIQSRAECLAMSGTNKYGQTRKYLWMTTSKSLVEPKANDYACVQKQYEAIKTLADSRDPVLGKLLSGKRIHVVIARRSGEAKIKAVSENDYEFNLPSTDRACSNIVTEELFFAQLNLDKIKTIAGVFEEPSVNHEAPKAPSKVEIVDSKRGDAKEQSEWFVFEDARHNYMTKAK